ncbi:protoporphyrinogen oxidase, mitochondrial isoform X2 [Ananas comosus]|uniref:Protoporphyrinogen oxidase n=1 Tax=Ananas comosus TaxID=4615 RepID=A0A6P5GUZ6_ANACO|nr:protoporphyrinogen oxidase, mitochondrial isoform X2 [Ananas comosus]
MSSYGVTSQIPNSHRCGYPARDFVCGHRPHHLRAPPLKPLSPNPATIAASSSSMEGGKSQSPIKSVAIVGAGVSGLAAAYKLKSNGVRVTVFEAEERAGGKIRTNSENGFIWDEGANTMTESEMEVGRLIDDLGLRDKQQLPIAQNKRYIVRNGMPQLIPSNPIALITSSILSPKSKLKLLMEPFLWKQSGTMSSAEVFDESSHESVRKFFQRHFGKEVVDYLVDPFVAGTSAGDPESLSMRHAFPELWDLEKRYGSVIVGAIRAKKSAKSNDKTAGSSSPGKKRNQRASFSFHGGMQTLTDTLYKEIGGDSLKLSSKVLSLSCKYDESSPSSSWAISLGAKDANSKDLASQSFDAVIMTAPLSNVQEMKFTNRGNPFVLDFLPKVNYLPLSVLITAFKKENVRRPLEGFGVLVPSKEQENGLKTLGTLFSSMMFPDRAPSDQYLYTTFLGGSRNRELARAPLDVLKQIVTDDLKKLLGVEGQPTFVKHVYWKSAFPLYGQNYDLVLEAIEKMEKNLPGFFYAGNHRGGLSVGKAMTSGLKAADLVIAYLGSCTEEDA